MQVMPILVRAPKTNCDYRQSARYQILACRRSPFLTFLNLMLFVV